MTDHEPLADLQHRSVKENGVADALSGNPVLEFEEKSEETEPLRTVNALSLEEIKYERQGIEKRI